MAEKKKKKEEEITNNILQIMNRHIKGQPSKKLWKLWNSVPVVFVDSTKIQAVL